MKRVLEGLILTHGQWLHFTSGDLIFVQGQKPSGVFLINSGKVRLTMLDNDRVVCEREAGTGDCLGLTSAFNHKPYDMSARVLAEAIVGLVPCEVLRSALLERPNLRMHCLQALSAEFSFARSVLRAGINKGNSGLRPLK